MLKSNTVGKMIELLKEYPEDMELVNEFNENFCHMVNIEERKLLLSTKKPIAYCNTSGEYVYPSSEFDDYFGYSPAMGDYVSKEETTPLSSEKKTSHC